MAHPPQTLDVRLIPANQSTSAPRVNAIVGHWQRRADASLERGDLDLAPRQQECASVAAARLAELDDELRTILGRWR
jgi:hypothetical protein